MDIFPRLSHPLFVVDDPVGYLLKYTGRRLPLCQCGLRLFLDVLTGQDEPLPFANRKPPNEIGAHFLVVYSMTLEVYGCR